MKRFFITSVFTLFLMQQLFAQMRTLSALVFTEEPIKPISLIDLGNSGSSESKKSVRTSCCRFAHTSRNG